MPTININLTFSSDDGTAELFESAGSTTPGFPDTGTYDGSEGNPSGSITFSMPAVADGGERYWWVRTLEDWGVPAGSPVTNISLLTVDAKGETVGTTFDYYPQAMLLLGTPYFDNPSFKGVSTAWNGDQGWTALTDEFGDVITYPIASTVELWIGVDADASVFGSDTHQQWYDNLSFSITYTASADSTGTGALQAQAAAVSGSGAVETIHRGTGALQAQAASMAGYAQSLPSVHENVKTRTADTYILLADGVQVPLISFTVRRDENESATIVSPVFFEDVIAAAAALVINMESVEPDGSTTVTQLFSGTLDTFSTSISVITGNCVGAASWPANAVRDFQDVSFMRDDEAVTAYRTRVDPRFYPGDVGMFGLTRINVDRVTFTVNEAQAYMELSNLGQV